MLWRKRSRTGQVTLHLLGIEVVAPGQQAASDFIVA